MIYSGHNIYLYKLMHIQIYPSSNSNISLCWKFGAPLASRLLHWFGLSFTFSSIMQKKHTHTVHLLLKPYMGTCWVDTWLTGAEQRAAPPITDSRACGLAPLVRMSAAPHPLSQKQGNGLCYSWLLMLQQIWGWVYSPPCLFHTRSFPSFLLHVSRLLPILSVLCPWFHPCVRYHH